MKIGVKYTDELKAELNKRQASYKNSDARMVTTKESKERIQKLLSRHCEERSNLTK